MFRGARWAELLLETMSSHHGIPFRSQSRPIRVPGNTKPSRITQALSRKSNVAALGLVRLSGQNALVW